MCGKRYPLKQHVTRHMRKIHAELAPVKRQRAKPNTLLAGASSTDNATNSDSSTSTTARASASDAEAFLNGTLHMDLDLDGRHDAEAIEAEAGDSNTPSPAMSPKHAPLAVLSL